jgi:glycosyltransferase involved in cell wall biosynthesis
MASGSRGQNSAPRFSIVIPTYNRADLLRQAVGSALEQAGYEDFEVVVVDDCSTDATWDFLQSIDARRLRVARNDQRLGMTGNWNKAIRASTGDLIYILQDDDIALPRLLSVASRLFDGHSSASLLCFATCLIDDAGQNPRMYWQAEKETLLRAPEALLHFANSWTLSSTQVVFSRELYERRADFDVRPPIMSDADTILRWMVYADTILCPEPLALRRNWSGSVTSKTQFSAAMVQTMEFLVENVFHEAESSRTLGDVQLAELNRALRRSFLGR